mmetsp:Transcript_26984/g.26052  ORF Transcript_26984/g.26052 Transcript_26984/m.26052 type:complete len:112 (+) Transcript_26984:64-399(+)|eukprot:CAMPEP_0170546230 /NCGR_PEP_ID=MMETSP0211-20121228/4614_1 /TAXON_ID=311385 /ORGANISM="Pseudokeronopsis sp., Strain OXSARD2" /LENGTH=111 /DNA_ID=CAMNT_0010850597 /DNA_START=49 /DNA_END=384 /DNA_ORIENTATION=-
MRYVAAYLLATLGGNESPKAADVKAILGSVGIEADAVRLDAVIKALDGKKVEDLIKEGSELLTSVPSGGAAPVAAAPAAGGAAPAAGGKKDEKPADDDEESDGDMGFGLFD